MEMFSWVILGLLAAFLAKVSIPAEQDENIFLLIAIAVITSVAAGFLIHGAFRTGFMSLSGVSHTGAFLAAAIALLLMRLATAPRIPKPGRR